MCGNDAVKIVNPLIYWFGILAKLNSIDVTHFVLISSFSNMCLYEMEVVVDGGHKVFRFHIDLIGLIVGGRVHTKINILKTFSPAG